MGSSSRDSGESNIGSGSNGGGSSFEVSNRDSGSKGGKDGSGRGSWNDIDKGGVSDNSCSKVENERIEGI